MSKPINLEQMPYHIKLINRYDECLTLRVNNPEKYPKAVETFFFHALTTDRRETALEKFEELAEKENMKKKIKNIDRVKSMKQDPYKKGNALKNLRSKISKQTADLLIEAGRYAMEEADDFEKTYYEDNRPRGGD